MIIFLLYHFLMFFLDLLLLWSIRRYPPTTLLRFLNLAEQGLLAVFLLGIVLGWGDFNLIIHGLAWHGGFFLLGSAFLIRRQTVNHQHQTVFPLVLFLCGVVYLGVAVDALLIEPTAIVIRRHTITTPKITKPMKIIFLTDLQMDQVGRYERTTLELVKQENADLILLGGDYLQARTKEHEDRLISELNTLLREMNLDAPYGVYAVQGNQENGTWFNWTRSFRGTNITPISRTVSFNAGEIRLTLLSMYGSFTAKTVADKNPENRFRIIVGHAPLFALAEQEAELLLAGHTHGGQVQIPGYGAIITMSEGLPNKWASGLTVLPEGSTLIVSNGTGLERGRAPRVRFFCRPDFYVIELVPTKSNETSVTAESE
ncbi:MAG: metallophosphoesterase [Planctomycetaceae bacterium]|jgi:predicted MPP superfamily phosphohydrolase|nr:metallophosphoesterase [Planctomycetaceae bacterium]